MNPRSYVTALLTAGTLGVLLPAGPLAAQTTTNVPIANFSFETPALGDGASSVGLNQWIVVGNTLGGIGGLTPLTESILTDNPTDAQYVGTTGAGSVGTMEGSQITSFRTGLLTLVGSASQITGSLLSLNTRFTLNVAVGNPLDRNFQGYTVALLSGGTTLASVSNVGIDVPNGTFRDVTLDYVLDPLNPNLTNLINTPLIVSLSVPLASGISLETLTPNYGTDFDNIRLTATVVPEPGTTASVGVGLLGLIGAQYARRRRSLSLRA